MGGGFFGTVVSPSGFRMDYGQLPAAGCVQPQPLFRAVFRRCTVDYLLASTLFVTTLSVETNSSRRNSKHHQSTINMHFPHEPPSSSSSSSSSCSSSSGCGCGSCSSSPSSLLLFYNPLIKVG